MGKSVAPILIGVAVGFAAPYAAGAIGSAMSGVAAPTLAGATGFANTMATIGATQTFSMAAAMGAGGLAMTSMAEQPQMPDYGMAFSQQQGQLDNAQSFQRKNSADLEYLLENGSTYEKNRAFEELEGRGEDAARLLEVSTRRDRTEENQDDIDRYIESTTPPNEEQREALKAQLYASESKEIKDDVNETFSQLTQAMAQQGMGSSNKARQLQAELAETEANALSQLRKDIDARVINYAQGVSRLQDDGLNRILRGAGYEDTATRYNLQVQDHERALSQGLRNQNVAQSNALGLEKFRADIQGMNNKFLAQQQDKNTSAQLGLGALGLGMDYFKPSTTTPDVGKKNSFAQPTLASSGYATPSMPSYVDPYVSTIGEINYGADSFGRTNIEPNPNRF
jgi:hypothetical protein